MNLNTERQVFDYGIYKNHTGRGKYLMDTRDDILIIDVRNPEEFAEGTFRHAVNIPNPSITNRDIPELPDKNQELLVYCRSGQRSKLPPKSWTSWGIKISRISAASWTGNMR